MQLLILVLPAVEGRDEVEPTRLTGGFDARLYR